MAAHSNNTDKTQDTARQKGSALLFVLIGVVMFAALSFVIARGMRSQSTDALTAQTQGLSALDIMDYAQSIRNTVDRLRSKGCSENELSFEKSPFDGSDTPYVNASSPSDFSCFIFHPQGGNLTYKKPQDSLNGGVDWVFTWSNKVRGVGTDDPSNFSRNSVDLIAWLPYISLDVCTQINKKLNIPNPPPQDLGNVDYYAYRGLFISEQEILDAGNVLEGKHAACFEANTVFAGPENGGYHYYMVVLER